MEPIGSLGDIWIRGFFDRNESLCLACQPDEYATHAEYVTKLIECGIDPEHFVRSLSQAKAKKLTEGDERAVVFTALEFSTGDAREVEFEIPVLDWLLDNMQGMIEMRIDRLESAIALLLDRAIRKNELSITAVAEAIDADGVDFRLK